MELKQQVREKLLLFFKEGDEDPEKNFEDDLRETLQKEIEIDTGITKKFLESIPKGVLANSAIDWLVKYILASARDICLKGNFKKQKLPDIEVIADKLDIAQMLGLLLLIPHLLELCNSVPLLGKITNDGMVIPNEEEIRKFCTKDLADDSDISCL
jgi:hypothetical protein